MLKRYACITQKQKREIVLLQGKGCAYQQCRFCDYYLDVSENPYQINQRVLQDIQGIYGVLEVINSGSFNEIDERSFEELLKVVIEKNIKTLIFECHFLYRRHISPLKARLEKLGIVAKFKIGLESFDFELRENVLKKGIKTQDIGEIVKDFDYANFLLGVEGQNLEMIKRDIALGLQYFERICLNVMCDNSKMQANQALIEEFKTKLMPLYLQDDRVDILLENTDFGVG